MIQFVEASWLADQLALPSREILILDPRLRVRYTSGHLKDAVHMPMKKAFDSQGRLLSDERLARWLGSCGVTTERTLVLYDQFGGGGPQAGSMMAWVLQYLGHPDVRFLRVPFERWKADGRDVFYRPVNPEPATFKANPRSELRTFSDDLAQDSSSSSVNIIDTRGEDEYTGAHVATPDDLPGHIPGARNIPWMRLVSEDNGLFLSEEKIRDLLQEANLAPDRKTITYCRAGPRAAVALIALQQLGSEVSLYDGSFADWSRRDKPREISTQ